MNYCPNCGKKIQAEADVCVNCGKFLTNEKSISSAKTKKVPGKGLSIAGMILGIIAILIITTDVPMTLIDNSMEYYTNLEVIEDIVMSISISITGVVLSAVGFKKLKSGFNISGLVLNSVSIFLSIVAFIIEICIYI